MAKKAPSEQVAGNAPPAEHRLPGRRAGLPPGSLRPPYFGPQGDENRDPPPDAPSAPPLASTEDERRDPSLKPKT